MFHMFRLNTVWKDLKDTSNYIGIATVLFFVGIFIGGTNENFAQFLNGQLEAVSEIANRLDGSSNPTLTTIIFIFLNNAIKVVFVLFAGALFGILPFFFLIINGMIIGYLLQLTSTSQSAMTVGEVIFKGLLPHGILEIPALLIGCAYGLRAGMLLFRTFHALIVNQNKLDQIGRMYVQFLKKGLAIAVYLVVILLIASIIESTFTVWLLSQ